MSVVTRRSAKPVPEDEMTLAQIVSEMQELREVMDRDQAEIERLKAETLEIKLETRAIMAETRALLNDLNSMVQSC